MSKKTSFWSAIFSLITIPIVLGLGVIVFVLDNRFKEYPTVSAFLVTLSLFLVGWKLLKQQEVINDLKRKYEGEKEFGKSFLERDN